MTGGGVTGGGGGGGGAGGGASRTASPSSLLRGAPAAPGTVARTTVATAQRALGERRIAAARQVCLWVELGLVSESQRVGEEERSSCPAGEAMAGFIMMAAHHASISTTARSGEVDPR